MANGKNNSSEPNYIPLKDLKADHRKIVRQFIEEGNAIHVLKLAQSPHDVKKKALAEQVLKILDFNRVDGITLNDELVYKQGETDKPPTAAELLKYAQDKETRQFTQRLENLIKKLTGKKAAFVKFRKGHVKK